MPLRLMPFPGLRFNQRKIPDLSRVLAPPYDVISEAERQVYLARSPYNVLHLTLGEEYESDTANDNRFTRAAALLRQWRRTGVLVPEAVPALYLYQQDFTLYGETLTRTGFITLVRLEEYHTGVILPHEHTFAGPKADLFRLWSACRANLSQIFVLYHDASRRLESCFPSRPSSMCSGEKEPIASG